jgi:hypothetical protein
MKVDYLDCCSNPDLEGVKVLLDTNREGESLCQCKTCGAYWFHRFLEIMKFDRPDDQTVWYSPVTEEEARRILDAEGRPDLGFLLTRPSFQVDDQGVRHVSGQPDKPCYG